jgi:para-nitrobenzyl esterase
MRLLGSTAAAWVLLWAGAAWAAVTTTQSGAVEGTASGGVLIFKGIPYAAPPIGALRWRPPQPVAGWPQTRDATQFGAACPQPERPDRPLKLGPTSEDCLYLNIWTPALAGRHPVMVWLHGGAFRIGSGSVPIYDGTQFAKSGVVLVTLNYRLGRFGFFAHPALAAANPADARGNYGLMDQAAALEWVKANIAAFGGDPGNVTLFGESAGGASVLHLLTSPKAAALFQKAIVESGGGHQIDRALDTTRLRSSLTEEGIAWARGLGVAPDADASALRAFTTAQVLGDGQLAAGLAAVGPVIDGDWVPDDPGVRLQHGDFQHVPVLIGANSYEASVLTAFETTPTQLVQRAGIDRAKLERLYAGMAVDEAALAARAFGDATFVSGARFVAGAVSNRDLPAYLYHFDYVLERRRGKVAGAGHGTEIPYVFDSFGELPPIVRLLTTGADDEMARRVHRYWVNFATTGDPNGAGQPNWPRYARDSDETLVLRPQTVAVAGFRAAPLDFFQQRWQEAEGRIRIRPPSE